LIILIELGNKLESHVKYLLPFVCSISNQMTSYGKLCFSKLASTARTSFLKKEEIKKQEINVEQKKKG